MTNMLSAMLLVGLLPSAEDDLAVVRKAVSSPVAQAQASTPAPKKADKPQWLRVRVVEKGAKKAKVSVNVPLALVRLLGDDCPIQLPGKADKRLRLSELLEALDSGQDIVEIDDDNATVRVWVD